MNISLFSKTPTVMALDNRGLTVREMAYHRHPDSPDITDERIIRHQFNARGFPAQSADPRLYAAGLVNFGFLSDLGGTPLRTQSADAGTTVVLNDAAGRTVLQVSNIGAGNDRSAAVTRTFQYEDASLPGRLLSVTEQGKISERLVWAGNSADEQSHNLAGLLVSHYDPAGLLSTNSISLSGVPLSVTRQLLPDDAEADWQGADASAWNDLLAGETYTTTSTVDSAGNVLTTTDAKGNQQRVAYDVAGLLKSSWLTISGAAEQAIVKSLSYSAAGQKLREEHGNGVVTTYSYEAETQRLVGIKTERPTAAKVLQDLRYEYDPVGNVLVITNDAEETRFWRNQEVVPENTYTYDSLYQLISATGREMANAVQQNSNLPDFTSFDDATYTNYSRTYTYDNAGNLTRIQHSAPASGNNYTTSITVSDRSNRAVLSTFTENPADVEALFTAGGQQKQLLPGQNLNWTPRQELQQVTPVIRSGEPDDSESYRYDAASQRIVKTTSQLTGNTTQTKRVIYLPGLELRSSATEELQVITVGEAGRAQVRVLHWESGQPDGISNDPIRYSYDNLTGSSSLEVDSSGELISQEEYYPYGGTALFVARSQLEADYKTIRYSGKEQDATGLYYYGYRYYQPWAGRWLSADPAGGIDGLNLFRMVRNNPVSQRDDNGLIATGNAARRQVAMEFITPQHMAAIEVVSELHEAIISFREAGVYTIDALNSGAAAKGHNILEKTIKTRSLEAAYGEKADEIRDIATEAGLIGLVGNWKGKGNTISGIWVHNVKAGVDEPFRLSLTSSEDLHAFNLARSKGDIVPYTGDYDMHDIILKRTRRPPGVGSAEEKQIINSINRYISILDPARPFEQIHMNPVRHGAQNNFVPYMWQEEFEDVAEHGGYIRDVAMPGPFPVAIVKDGEWTIAEDEDEWRGFFRENLISQPRHWNKMPRFGSGDWGLLKVNKHYVITPQHQRQLSLRRATIL
ncbi:hypothetical protein BK796_10035 [Kosakonia pseudosacchari]|uniref:RHS repeat protein n=1 Tax=Kosakonia pseudosacchari TaxID=1646340 RepID=A0ABX4IRX4_9ENTR|nr:RHS repeat domain-containing protein [Kosakonia pseudosacchari]PDO86784.1 hypothetical protein BK796_10035 [Kosakonia pseudosacchari]